MKKAVLIVGIASFLLFLGLTLLFPPCTLCVALLAGAVAGWLAVRWGRPEDEGRAAAVGAQAGALAGLGALLGQTVGGILNALLVGPEQAMEFLETLGMTGADLGVSGGASYYLAAIGGQACCGLLNVGLFAGLGALAGFLYFKFGGRNRLPQAGYQE